ncbi:radical SAM protein [Sulfurimonas sp.]|uniref:B12-binding domain-containing radical SAM protein n=1 Tax=Sulfurimonas sp. TaxID=2022749 RepID=UPI0025D73900|nr:radical SAM protein [Sulfurimonas sp.]
MNDIIFINPPYEQIAPGNDHVKHVINRSPSLGLLLLAAQARKDGYSPKIIESDLENLSPQTVANMVLEINPKFVGITLFTVGVFNAAIIAKLIKEKNPNIVIMVGGPHISSMGFETMQKFENFDIAALYEGELILNKLLSSIENNDPLEEVQGIVYRDENNTLRRTPPPPSIKDLDSLPIPAWDLLPNFPKAYLPAIFDYPRAPVATYSASRGCPFKCEFCDTSTFGTKIRYNSSKKVHEIMKHLSLEYGIKHLQFVDDLFVANNAKVLELCELLITDKVDMTWSCTARVDTVKPDTLKKMKEAGCWEISFGLESGSDEMLKNMKKSITAEVSARAVNWTSEAGIRVKGLFMLGYPGETKESVKVTKEFIKSLPLTTMNLSKFTPYPGSQFIKSYTEHLLEKKIGIDLTV